jgi:transcriptional regulator GlxA family with amidase domain
MVAVPNTPQHTPQQLNSSDRNNKNQIQFTVEVVTLDIPDAEGLGQAFEKIKSLENYLKPIVIEILAKRLGVSKKTLEKAFQVWLMEQIKKSVQDNQQNREGR